LNCGFDKLDVGINRNQVYASWCGASIVIFNSSVEGYRPSLRKKLSKNSAGMAEYLENPDKGHGTKVGRKSWVL